MDKSSAITVLFFLMFAPITFQCAKSETFIIVVTSESACFESGSNESSLGSGNSRDIDRVDEEPECLTLQQFVTRFSNNKYKTLTNITLELNSGEHSLNSTLSLFSVASFTMRSDAAATIVCSQPGVRLQLHYIEDVVISGTTFVGCEEIEVSFVDQFRFENSSFQSSPNGSLTLNHTMNATLFGSSFLKVKQSNCHKAAITINKSSVLIQHCIFSESQGVINSTLSAITIDSCIFMNNSLISCDEILYADTAVIMAVNGPQTMTITNCDFIDNHRIPVEVDIYGTSVIVSISGSALILNNSFVSNTGFKELLELGTEYDQIIMANNWFSSNTIYNHDFYGAAVQIYATETSITISNNNFTDNNGIALVVHVNHGTVLVTVSHSNFLDNRQSEETAVGALAIIEHAWYNEYNHDDSSNVSVVIVGCTFVSLERAVNIYMDHSGSVSIVQSTFIDNFALEYNAAIEIELVTGSSVLIDSCTFNGNKGPNGGAVYIKSGASSIVINHTTFLNNQGGGYLGAALTGDVNDAQIVINGSYFSGNINTGLNWTRHIQKWYVGTVCLAGTYTLLIIDKSTFVNNAVNAINSASFNSDLSTLMGSIVILRSNFINNTNPFYLYGGVSLSASTVEIAETTFLNNSARGCGALLMDAHNINITNSHFVHNSAVNYSGGAICGTIEAFKQMSISNSTFSHNYAKKNGGVLQMMTDIFDDIDRTIIEINISGSTFDNNKVDMQGGVLWTASYGAIDITVANSLFTKNQAGSDGGVAVMNINYYQYGEINNQLIISGSSFDQNRASRRGGVFAGFNLCTYLIENSSFTGNQAGTDGGVMYVGRNNSRVRISDGSIFDFNNATSRGGVISINGSRLEISNTTIFYDNFADIGDDIIACNCDISTAFTLQSYTDPNFPNCTLFGHYEVITADSLPTKPAGTIVAMAISIPTAFIMILLLLTATLLGAYMCLHRRRCLVKQYGVRRSDDPDFVPLMNTT